MSTEGIHLKDKILIQLIERNNLTLRTRMKRRVLQTEC
ncbi:hypothetical protein DZA29_01735 [Citrobacter gillenii]|nr:hypothetical protein DZA29_01735 [Citrobacter gillenii]